MASICKDGLSEAGGKVGDAIYRGLEVGLHNAGSALGKELNGMNDSNVAGGGAIDRFGMKVMIGLIVIGIGVAICGALREILRHSLQTDSRQTQVNEEVLDDDEEEIVTTSAV